MEGSSPHTRGARDPQGRPPPVFRIIPAYAGSTLTVCCWVRGVKDHPRIRGEHVSFCLLLFFRLGSSPHTRGALYGAFRRRARARGSSPHTRGALLNGRRFSRWCGIIPAYAGSTPIRIYSYLRTSDHPRIRGEHFQGGGPTREMQGSSPHTRGAREGRAASERRDRIIPAYAGSTGWPKHHIKPHPDHPRIRGEHGTIWSAMNPVTGSSPHTRGARRTGTPSRPRGRIIPAYAGSTAKSTSSR